MKAIWGSLLAAAIVVLGAIGCTQNEAAMAPLDEGDVVHSGIGPEEASNLQRFYAFLAVTESGGDDAVRLVNMTVEGSPIYTDISYSEGKYIVFIDHSEDAYAAKENRERKKAAECTELVKTDRPDEFQEYACGEYSFLVKDF
jgi:hypothetical protein